MQIGLVTGQLVPDLQALAQRIDANKVLKRDFIAETKKLTFQIQRDEDKAGKTTSVLEVDDQGSFPVLQTAHEQIADRLKIPAKYYQRMQVEAPDLLATNVNAWFRIAPEKRMIRTLGGDTRAFLSNRYNRIENEEIAEVALPVLARIPDVKIVSAQITDKRLYIQAVSPRVEGEVKKGDVVQAGVIISNSEIGYGAVTVAPIIYRLICLNGMICQDRYRAYHVGRVVEDNDALWADDTRQADDRAVLLKVRDMVNAAVDETAFKGRIEALQGLTQANVTGDPAKAVEVLAQKVGATEAEQGGILRALIQGGDLSAWGLLNAVTHQAHDAQNYDRAVELEAAGGKLAALTDGDWKKILEAA